MTARAALERLVVVAGGVSAAAAAVGLADRRQVQRWRAGRCIPANHATNIEHTYKRLLRERLNGDLACACGPEGKMFIRRGPGYVWQAPPDAGARESLKSNDLEDALRAAETYREALESTRADLARVTAERDAARGALHRWMAQPVSDEVLRRAGRDPVIEFQGRRWRIVPSVVPHTCEGCDAQKAPGVPCGVRNWEAPPCRDGILKRAEVQP